jgi:hypothetical protein
LIDRYCGSLVVAGDPADLVGGIHDFVEALGTQVLLLAFGAV